MRFCFLQIYFPTCIQISYQILMFSGGNLVSSQNKFTQVSNTRLTGSRCFSGGCYSNSLCKLDSATHLRLKCNDLQNHLNSEHPSEDHVQNIHGIIEHLGLLIVLDKERGTVLRLSHDLTPLQMEAPQPSATL